MPEGVSRDKNYVINYQCPRCGCRYSISSNNQGTSKPKLKGDKIATTILYLIGIPCVILIIAVFALYFMSMFMDVTPALNVILSVFEGITGSISGFMERLQDNPNIQGLMTFLPRIVVMLVCFPIHECAHAWTAYKLGDNTGKLQGRITLNPFKHLDMYGALMVLLAGIGYAKPVPVNPANFKHKKRDMALTAFAGPFSNMLMAVCILFIIKWHGRVIVISGHDFILQLLLYTAYINISLAVFNMIPVPPLDGSKVLGAVLPDGLYNDVIRKGPKAALILFLAIMLCNRMGYSPIGTASGAIFNRLYGLIVMGTL